MVLLGVTIRAAVLIFLLVAGAWVALLALYAGNPLLALLAGVASLTGCTFVAVRSSRRLTLCGATVLLGLGLAGLTYFVVVPLVIFKIDSRAFPGNMVVEFNASCPDSTRGILRRRIEYIVSASGYGCSSTHLPGWWFRLSLVFYDDDPNVTREPPPLAEGTFF